ncbi:Uncharacterised protein [Candidatus Tiddalikarchaeum anstoanum]|nr:Uncharacterised protein [Candidatus Tiddalikarchaeum anstoanum]
MIFDCNAVSTITALLENKIVRFVMFNSKKVTFDSKSYFVVNMYAYIGEDTAVRLRHVTNITNDAQASNMLAEVSKTLEEFNQKYKVLIFEGSVKDEDSSLKLFSKYQ